MTLKIKELPESKRKHFNWFIIIYLIVGCVTSYTYRTILPDTTPKIVMYNDSEGYYQYLPYFFINDWDQMDEMRWAKNYAEGKKINLYSSGVAIMEMPFFLTAHLVSYFFDLETTGYTNIYFVFIFFAGLSYVLIGLIFLYKFLRNYFNHKYAFWTMVLIYFATNIYYYSTFAPGMSHAYSFSLVCMLLYFTVAFYKNPVLKNLIIISLLLAILTLIRPTNLLFAIIIFLFEVQSIKKLRERMIFWEKHWYYILIMLITGFITFIPQMLYWHLVTGKYLFYSYLDAGFSNILSPKIITVLFGARNGWYIYTPIMFIASMSLLILFYKKVANAWQMLLIMLIIIYLNSSWFNPTFSGAAGYRALIEYIPLMAMPLSWFLENTDKNFNKTLKIVVISFLTIFVIYNIIFSFKYDSHTWWNKEWTWTNFLRFIRY